jgi:ATP-dependent DNA helicase RecG
MRSGESLVPMSEDQLRRIFAEGKPDWLEEPAQSGLSDGDVVRLLNTPKVFELLQLPYPTSQQKVIERLCSERLIDSGDQGLAVRNIGAMLLAKKLSEFPDLERKAPRVVVYSGKSKTETKLDQLGSLGYAVAFSGLVSFVMAQIPQNEVIKDSLRTEIKLVPEIAIRELVANAMIHQDFSVTGARIVIDIYNNRIEISNPGSPIISAERFIDGYQSRNERLADFMRRMRICEEKGSGIDKVVSAAEVYQLPAPRFTSDGIRTQVTIFGPMKMEDMDRLDRIRACYQHCCLKYVMSERMTNQSLRRRFGLPESKSAIVSQAIAATVDEKMVKLDEKVGSSRRFARYIPFWA